MSFTWDDFESGGTPAVSTANVNDQQGEQLWSMFKDVMTAAGPAIAAAVGNWTGQSAKTTNNTAGTPAPAPPPLAGMTGPLVIGGVVVVLVLLLTRD